MPEIEHNVPVPGLYREKGEISKALDILFSEGEPGDSMFFEGASLKRVNALVTKNHTGKYVSRTEKNADGTPRGIRVWIKSE